MFKNDSFVKGFLIGLIINAVMTGIVWALVEKVGVTWIENTTKLYMLAAIPATIFMWYSIRKKGCVNMGIGVLLSVIILVALFFLFIYKTDNF